MFRRSMRRGPKKNEPPGGHSGGSSWSLAGEAKLVCRGCPFATIPLTIKLIRRKSCGRADTPPFFFTPNRLPVGICGVAVKISPEVLSPPQRGHQAFFTFLEPPPSYLTH